MELIILIFIALFVVLYRQNPGDNVYRFFVTNITNVYEKYAPYSFKTVREKAKELGQEYNSRQYLGQIVIFAGFAGGIAYLYFYSLLWALVYAVGAIAFIPYLAYLRCQRIYSEFDSAW